MNTRVIVLLATAAIVAIALIGIGYATTHTGSMTSTDNSTFVTQYALDIYSGDSYSEATMLTQSLYLPDPQFSYVQGVHTVVSPEHPVTSISGYKIHSDNDYELGAHIRMWVLFDNVALWIFVDHIDLTIVTRDGFEESFTCGIVDNGSGIAVSGVCTDVVALPVHKTEHPFEITVYFKEEVPVDFIDAADLNISKPVVVFVYDDIDPVGSGS